MKRPLSRAEILQSLRAKIAQGRAIIEQIKQFGALKPGAETRLRPK
jgi:hypothetical protein